MAKIRVLHNGGAGKRANIETPTEMNIRDLFLAEFGTGADPGLYTILVKSATDIEEHESKGSYTLRDGDVVSFTPNKLNGA
jgi:hypothetical protein